MRTFVVIALGVGLAGGIASATVAAERPSFPPIWPDTDAEAIALLCPADESRAACLRARLQDDVGSPGSQSAGVRRAMDLLARREPLPTSESTVGPDGIVVRYDGDPRGPGHIPGVDLDGDRRPDGVDATVDGLKRVRDLIVGQLELPAPRVTEVVLRELGPNVDGYVVPIRGRTTSMRIVLDATTARGADGVRRAVMRQYAYAAAEGVGAGLPTGWAEGFATWTVLALDGVQPEDAGSISAGLATMDRGLLADGSPTGALSALWLAFLQQAYGLTAVRLTVEELASQQPVEAALERALRRASDDGLDGAFREFHLWTLLTGERADTHHFSFAPDLRFPGFAATSYGLPALSVHREPPVGALGSAQIRLLPQEASGGLRVHFEGDLAAHWDVGLLLVNADGTMHRVPLSLSSEGRGELTVPLDGLNEVLLLIRNLQSDDGAAHRYTYFAHHEPSFPFELTALQLERAEGPGGGVLVAWDTGLEQDLVGFDILRRRDDGDSEQRVNPVWVPALGGFSEETSYRYLDRTADADAGYVYRIQGITTSGLVAFSESVAIGPATGSSE